MNELVKIGQGMTVRMMDVTPDTARDWVDKTIESNRPVNKQRVRQYAHDMASKVWRVSDQPITFNVNSKLVNGRHRCLACILADTPFPSMVMWGLPDESMLVLDSGKKRSTDDALIIAGREWPRGCGATVRRVFLGVRGTANRSYSDQEIDQFMVRYGASVRFAHTYLPRGKVCRAHVRAVVTRAHACKRPEPRLREFCNVLMTGFMSKGDDAAVALRNYLIEKPAQGGGADRKTVYGIVEASLQAFLIRVIVRDLKPADGEVFPLPGLSTDDLPG